MALLDVNVLVALAWDSHVHHVAATAWFDEFATAGWSTCPITESGFVRVSANPSALPVAISIEDALVVLAALRTKPAHRFLVDDVSILEPDLPAVIGYRQVTDAHLLTLARRHGENLVTFDRAVGTLASGSDVEILRFLPAEAEGEGG